MAEQTAPRCYKCGGPAATTDHSWVTCYGGEVVRSYVCAACDEQVWMDAKITVHYPRPVRCGACHRTFESTREPYHTFRVPPAEPSVAVVICTICLPLPALAVQGG